jgi:hypothetical protein
MRAKRVLAGRLQPFETVMPTIKITSFWYAIYKRLWAVGKRGEAAVAADAVRYYMAVPVAVYERYVAKGGSHRGFETVTDVPKPFPEAVILRQTVAGARLEFADHRREEFFGLALGVEILRETRMSEIEMVHMGHDGRVVGGFTLRPEGKR